MNKHMEDEQQGEWFWWSADDGAQCYSYEDRNGIMDGDGFAPAVILPTADGSYYVVIWHGPKRHQRDRGNGERTDGFVSLSDAKKYVEVVMRLDEAAA
jgi:hypothetical protein